MEKISSFVCGILCCLLISCSSPRVITYAHSSAEFDRYRTFNIKSHSNIQDLSPEGHESFERLDELIADQMMARGYSLSRQPDIVIEYEISSGLSQNTPNQYYDRYSYWYYPSYSYSAPDQDVEAMIEIEMIDPGMKKTVWTGSADFTLRPRRDDNVEKVEQHIVAIFERFNYSAAE